jgi:hypothetical protein
MHRADENNNKIKVLLVPVSLNLSYLRLFPSQLGYRPPLHIGYEDFALEQFLWGLPLAWTNG